MHRFKRGEDDRGAVATGQRATTRDDEAALDRDAARQDLDRDGVDDRAERASHTPQTALHDRDGDGVDDRAERTPQTALHDRDGDGVDDRAERTRPSTSHDRDGDGVDDRAEQRERTGGTAAHGVATRDAMQTARARQRDEYGGINWGASFFGWLVAVGVAALLTSILAAAGTAIGLTTTSDSALQGAAEELSLGGAIALLVVLLVAYYAGGYVAGRMSRFDGARQGLGTWAIGLVVTIGLAVAAVILGDEYNILERLNLPSLPVGDSTLATGGIIALAAIVLGTVLAAIAGGKVGERYHKKVDRAGFVD
jgi:hypothetical protein